MSTIKYFCPKCGKELSVVPDGWKKPKWLGNADYDVEQYEVVFEYTDPDHKVWSTLYRCLGCGAEGENPYMAIKGDKYYPMRKED